MFPSVIATIYPCLSCPSEGRDKTPTHIPPTSSALWGHTPAKVPTDRAKGKRKSRHSAPGGTLLTSVPDLIEAPSPTTILTPRSLAGTWGAGGVPQLFPSPVEAGGEEEAVGESGQCPWWAELPSAGWHGAGQGHGGGGREAHGAGLQITSHLHTTLRGGAEEEGPGPL